MHARIAMVAVVLILIGALAGLWAAGIFDGSEGTPPTRTDPSYQPVRIASGPPPAGAQLATFGAGCFWCTEAVFQQVKGVHSVVSGYSGGTMKDPFYEAVCTGRTGHAEVVQITFDPKVVSFTDLLEVFWHAHDPTTLNRQGHDLGTQYRSVIFYHTEEQKTLAESFKQKLDAAKVFDKPIVTAIEPFTEFYPAEVEHQNYYLDNPRKSYCQVVIRPKLEKFKKVFAGKQAGTP